MKITINLKYYYWHHWFAWYPVNVSRNEKRWLETVNRRKVSTPLKNDCWEYAAYETVVSHMPYRPIP